jgi:hypothetical protein
MSGVVYTNRVIARNNFGQFIRECEQAAEATVEQTVTEGAEIAASFAPKRTLRLASSIKPFMLSRTSGVWGTNVPYAASQERGAVPHPISAYVSFYWHKVGRQWLHPPEYERLFGFPGADPIQHPGNPATHFLRDSFQIMSRRITTIAKARYPG